MWALTDFQIIRFLGKGRHSNVYLARDKTSKSTVVIKVLFWRNYEENELNYAIAREINAFTYISYPHHVKIYGCFRDDKRICFILEHVPGIDWCSDISQQPIRKIRTYSEQAIAKYIANLTNILKYCHSQNTFIRDLSNIDACKYRKDAHGKKKNSVMAVIRNKILNGIVDYVAPEILLGKSFDKYSDMWILGVLVYELIAGTTPFCTHTYQEAHIRILRGDITFPLFFSEDLKDFISKLLAISPKNRLTYEQVLCHPWLLKNTTKEERKSRSPTSSEENISLRLSSPNSSTSSENTENNDENITPERRKSLIPKPAIKRNLIELTNLPLKMKCDKSRKEKLATDESPIISKTILTPGSDQRKKTNIPRLIVNRQ